MQENKFDKMERGLARLVGRPVTFMESAETKEKDVSIDVLKAAACDMLEYANEFHVYHWNASSNFEHEIMNEAYDLMRDTADRLAERYLSFGSVSSFVPEGNFGTDRKDWSPGKDTVLSRMESILDGMNRAMKENPGLSLYGGIGNIFADFDEKMSVLIYKYRRFKG